MSGNLAAVTSDRRRGALAVSALVAGIAIVASVGSGGRFGSGGSVGDYNGLLTLYGIAVYSTVGIVILWQRPGHGIGRLTLAIGLAYAAAVLIDVAVTAIGPIPLAPSGALDWANVTKGLLATVVEVIPPITIWLGGVLLIAWFPDGRPTSTRGRIASRLVVVVASLVTIGAIADSVAQASGFDRGGAVGEGGVLAAVTGNVASVALVVAFGLAVWDLLARYRRTDPLRKAQIRWVIGAAGFAGVMTALVVASLVVLPFDIPGLWDIWIMSLLLPILAIGIAVTRYHLYDIDRIVSRSISYAIITVVLFGSFAVVNLVVTQSITSVLPEDARTVAVAVSTLVVASLFQPLRRRVQLGVDRRFHRSRYDAQRTVDGFAARLRGDVDLYGLHRALQAAAIDAVEPASTGVWLRPGQPS